MTFALTKYIYPLETEIVLSHHLGYKLDNPRNDDEIRLVKARIEKSMDERDKDENDTVAHILARVAFSLSDLKDKLKEIDDKSYPIKYYSDNYEKQIIDILAETWIIVRFPEDEEFEKIATKKDELFNLIFNKKETSYSIKFKELANYCHLVSLIANDGLRYHGESFLLSKSPYDIFYTNKDYNTKESVETFIGYNFLMKSENRGTSWLYWIDGYQSILNGAKRIETSLSQGIIQEKGGKLRVSQKQTPKQKLLHVGGLLKTSYEHLQDPELMLLLLVSILEYMVTRNPDTSKFNVEDSISKQFNLKCAILIYNQDKSVNLIELNQTLRKIYNQRSDLAHGNYKGNFKLDEVVESVYSLYSFIKHIINEYIIDRNLVEFLKDN